MVLLYLVLLLISAVMQYVRMVLMIDIVSVNLLLMIKYYASLNNDCIRGKVQQRADKTRGGLCCRAINVPVVYLLNFKLFMGTILYYYLSSCPRPCLLASHPIV